MLTPEQIYYLNTYLTYKIKNFNLSEVDNLLTGMNTSQIHELIPIKEDIDFIVDYHAVCPSISEGRVNALYAEAISDFRDKQWKCSLSSCRTLIRNDLRYFPIYTFIMGRCYQSLNIPEISKLFYKQSPISKIYKWAKKAWRDPSHLNIEITKLEEGEKEPICLEWFNDIKKLTVYIDSSQSSPSPVFTYIKVAGPCIQTDMVDGSLTKENTEGVFQWILKA